jgi:hypothetical protein
VLLDAPPPVPVVVPDPPVVPLVEDPPAAPVVVVALVVEAELPPRPMALPGEAQAPRSNKRRRKPEPFRTRGPYHGFGAGAR